MFDDARNTFRFLIREPQFALAVLGTLGLAIGINAGSFSVVEAIVIRPLPYPNPDQLVVGLATGYDGQVTFRGRARKFLGLAA
jgi:hypothetical protein